MSEQLSPKAIIAESIIENFEAVSSYVARQSLRDMLDENQTLRAENARLRRGLENCHMLARRIVTSESAFFKIDSANHIIRMCEEAGVTSVKGVLRDAALQPKEPKP